MFCAVDHLRDESIKEWNEFLIGGDFSTSSNVISKAIGLNVTDRWKDGDRFTLTVDFEKNEIELMYNDKNMGVVFSDIPKNIVPTISTYTAIELMCTKYECKC